MAFFARDILGSCCKKTKFARHFGKVVVRRLSSRDILGRLRRIFFVRRLRKFFLMVLVARDIYGRS